MSLARSVHSVTVDVEQLIRLYHQLFGVPSEVQQLFSRLQKTYDVLKDTETALTRGSPLAMDTELIHRFQEYKDSLIDIELFLDPEQILPRSGPGSDARGVQQWTGDQDVSSCGIYEGYLTEISAECQGMFSNAHRYGYVQNNN
jgi:DNA-binding transcriptional regulator PaaX